MTEHDYHNNDFLPPDAASGDNVADRPLEPWLAAIVQDAMHVEENAVPRDMMWARVRQQRRQQVAARTSLAGRMTSHLSSRTMITRVIAIAATLLLGVAIGRFAMPGASVVPGNTPATVASTATNGANEGGAVSQAASAPAVIAMEEHLARTVALLTTVRDESPDVGPGADVSGWARELLGTTRLLLDEPQLHDERTRRLLQDLELVLVQIIQARGSAAPEARRAPTETMRETNLLPRVRAVVTASVTLDESSIRGIAE